MIPFTKLHGLGNDFVIIDATQQPLDLSSMNIKQLADRHVGIGFDQLLIIQPSHQADFFCQIINSDGSEAEQCGNGLRCVARFLHESGKHPSSSLTIATLAGIFPISIPNYHHIRVIMGVPLIKERLISLAMPVSIISMGNPHAITKVDHLAQLDVIRLSREITQHAYFPEGANVGFMEIINRHHLRLRTIERGAGETLACGSNACAAAVAGIINGWLDTTVTVEYHYGSLTMEWKEEGQPITMTGPAERVYAGLL